MPAEWWDAGVVICLERGAELHMAQLMPLPLTASCFSKIQIGLTFLVPAHSGSPGRRPLNGCVCKYMHVCQLVFAATARSCRQYVNRQRRTRGLLRQSEDGLYLGRRSSARCFGHADWLRSTADDVIR